MRIKVNIWGFSGSKILPKEIPPTREDYKHARITPALHKNFYWREFDGMKGKTIQVSDVNYFCGLMRFFWKDYCCVLSEEDFTAE